MEEKSEKQGRVEASFEGGQGPEGAVAPYMDGWKSKFQLHGKCSITVIFFKHREMWLHV
jgi:hypothetical protein